MSEVLEFAARLSTVVGPRPAGTEEEQQASFFIEEVMSEAGLDTSVEEFNCNPNYEMPRIVCCIASIVLAILAIILPLMVLPAFIVCALAAVFYVLEVLGSSPLTNVTKGGVSQNVIAKYYPGMTKEANDQGENGDDNSPQLEKIDGKNAAGRRSRKDSMPDSRVHRKRKIVILARYDSGRVRAELKPPFIGILDKIHWAEIGGMVLVPVALLLRLVTGAIEEGHIVWDIFIGIGVVCSLLPVIAYIMHQTAAYSEGANNNASGVAVMTELAKRLVASSKPSLSSKVLPDADGLSFSLPVEPEDPTVIAAVPELSSPTSLPVFHGKDAIVDAKVLPVETDLIYEEAANGMLDKKNRELFESMAEGASGESTVAFMPVAAEVENEDSNSQPTHKGRNALSLETQMQSASKEFAKFDEHGDAENEDKGPWPRLQGQSSEADDESSSPGATANLGDVKTIAIPEAAAEVDDPNVPDWFKKGMAAASANKTDDESPKSSVKRSRFADALDAAHEASAQAIENFGGKNPDETDGISEADKAKLDELHAKIMGVPSGADASADSQEAKEARRAKVIAARDAKYATKSDLGAEEIAEEKLTAEEIAEEAETIATIEAKVAAQAAAQAQAAEEVAEQAAVADRTISFIPVAADMPAEVSAKSASETGSHEPLKKTAEEILDDAASLTGSRKAVSGDEDIEFSGRRQIAIPSLTSAKNKKGIQDAPLADDADRAKGEARTALKNVGGEKEYGASSSKTSLRRSEVKEGVSQSLEGATTSFLEENAEADALAALSSLDGPSKTTGRKTTQSSTTRRTGSSTSTPLAQQEQKNVVIPSVSDAPIAVSTAGSFVQPSQTSNFKPVGDELIANMNSEDIIIEDVDDSDYTENVTHTGAIAGPGYVEMPKSRMHRIKSFFGKKKVKEEDSISFSDAMGIDAEFDAREVGKARGNWESFKNGSSEFDKSAAKQDQGANTQNQQSQIPNNIQMQAGQNQSPSQMTRQGQSPSQDLQQNMPGNAQKGSSVMQGQPMQGQPMQAQPMQRQPMQGQPMQGQPMPGQMPMQGRPMPGYQGPMQGQPSPGQMPMQGRGPQQMPAQGQYPQQYQRQPMQYPMQPQQFQGQMPMQGQPMPGQMPMQSNSASQQQPVQASDTAVETSKSEERTTKKSHSFNFFRRKNEEGDMNSGAFDDSVSFDDDDWNGGAFSLGRDKDSSDGTSRRSRKSGHGSRGSRNQAASGGRRRSADEVLAEEAMAEMTEEELMAQDMLDERDQIRNFRSSSTQLTSFEEVAAFASSFSKQSGSNADGYDESLDSDEEPDIGFQTEVWFVALGAELANNAGIKMLLADHGDEMRGAVVIDIDALGAGQLSVIEEEGVIKRVKSSTRMRRYAKKAASSLGMTLGSGKMLWRESAAYYTTRRGLLTMHLCGMAGDKPAYAGEIDDTFDKLSEETMLQNTAFLLELINAI